MTMIDRTLTGELGAANGSNFTADNITTKSLSGTGLTNDADRFRDTKAMAQVSRTDGGSGEADGTVILEVRSKGMNEYRTLAVFPGDGVYQFNPTDNAEYRFRYSGPAVGDASTGAKFKVSLSR